MTSFLTSVVSAGKRTAWPTGIEWHVTNLDTRNFTKISEDGITQMLSVINNDEVAYLQFTSGSTSDPKGVCVTHKSLMHNLMSMKADGKFGEDSVTVSWVSATSAKSLVLFPSSPIIICRFLVLAF